MVDYSQYFEGFDGVQDALAKSWAWVIKAVSMLFFFLATPLDWTLNAITNVQKGAQVRGVKITNLSWIFKLTFAVLGFLFVFSTGSKDTVIAQSPDHFGIHVLLARGIIFFSALAAAFIGVTDVVVLVSSRSARLPDITLPDFEGKFSEYTVAFIHGATSLTIIAASFLWEEELSLAEQLANATVTDPTKQNGTSVAYLTLIVIAAYILKLWQELRHGAQQQAAAENDSMIGKQRDLKEMYKFKHARGPAITISVALLMYMLSNLPDDTHWYADIWTTPAYVLLVAYIVVVGLERVAVSNDQEWIYGGSHGIVVVGGIVNALLFFTGTLVGNHLTQDSIVFALGVVVLDAMRVGYGQATPEAPSAMSSDTTALVYRMFQGVFGILAFTLITVAPHESVDVVNATTNAIISTEETHAVASPVLYGIGLASALVKVLSLLFLSKTLYKDGTENYFREIASTGLLLCSAYLWEHPLDETMRPGWAYLFFVLAILARFADSWAHHVLSNGVDLKSYVNWYDKAEEKTGIDSPTSDNPRVWMTLVGLISALWCTIQVLADEDSTKNAPTTFFNTTTNITTTTYAPDNDELMDGLITSVVFISVHLVVVLFGLLSDANQMFEIGALSRSKLIRTAVTTTVISSLSVAAGALTIGETALLSSDSSESRMVLALLSYIVADTVGRELV